MKRRDFIRNCAIGSAAVAAPWAIAGETQKTGISFLDYVRHMEPNLVEGWHHKAISYAVEASKRLIVCAPPMAGKSMLFSKYLMAYYAGHNPSHSLICINSLTVLANERRKEFDEVIASRRHKEIFSQPWSGKVLYTGLGGSLKGRGANVLVFDDVGHRYGALSLSGDHVSMFDRVARRLSPDGRIYVTGSRFSVDDLYGKLMQRGGWDVLKIPAASNKGRIWSYEDSRKLGWMKQLPYDKVMAQYYQSP